MIDYSYDLYRFARFSNIAAGARRRDAYEALLTMEYHRIEKGLSLRNRRYFFGLNVLQRLVDLVRAHDPELKLAASRNCMGAISAYFKEHDGVSEGQSPQEVALARIKNQVAALSSEGTVASVSVAGFEVVAKNERVAPYFDFAEFMASRHSVRHFSAQPVDGGIIIDAARIALLSPSVCNRQAWQCYYSSDHETISTALNHQNGNDSFRQEINTICVITSKLDSFVSASERNQCWIDGGLFAMSFVLALHSAGVGSCCLNWSVNSWRDRAFRKAIRIPDDEVVIMMIAIGFYPDSYRVCISPRRNVADVVRHLEKT